MNASNQRFSFVAESTLGRLAKWLRLAGFDTIFDTQKPQAQRLAAYCRTDPCIILTRTEDVRVKLPPGATIYVSSDDPLHQIRQVICRLNLTNQDLRPLTICAVCNHPLVVLRKTDLQNRVADYTFRHHHQFHGCDQCGRVYWHGSHAVRWTETMRKWFEPH